MTGPRIVVFGNVNLELAVSVGDFPVGYAPSRTIQGGIVPDVSGTAYNIATALTLLDSEVTLCVPLGADPVGVLVADQLTRRGMTVLPAAIAEQPVTVVLADDAGRRLILNDYRGADGFHHDPYPATRLMAAADLVVLPSSGVNARLPAAAAGCGSLVAVDVETIETFDGPQRVWCEAADILFASHERLPCPPADWAAQVLERYPRCDVAVVGCGEQGAVLAVRHRPVVHIPAVRVGPVRSTLGAGDALFAAYLDGHLRGLAPWEALRRATVYASAKLAGVSGAAGLLDTAGLAALQADLADARR